MKNHAILNRLIVVLLAGVVATALPGCSARLAGPEEASPPKAPKPLKVARREVASSGVTVVTLDNGLTLIIQENHNAPVVNVQSFVRAGGMYEGPWLGCGVSHLLEHLVAKGATRGEGHAGPSKESRSRLDAIGAQSNAYTSISQTSYYISVVAGRTDDAIDILADWMARPDITEADFRREHEVVQRELEMGKDEAPRQFTYAHMANFYGDHPAAVPVIGYKAALQSVTYKDVLDYHARMYVPRNMVVTVVGDLNTAQVLDRLCKAFAGFDAARAPVVVLPEVSKVAGVRRSVVTSPAVKDVAERLSFRSIPLIHPDLYSLDVLSYVLTQGNSSRMYRALVREKQLATSIDSSSWTPEWGAGQFVFEFRAAPDKADAAEAELLSEIQKVIDEGVTADELDKAKRQKAADFAYSQQDVASQARTLASDWLSTGDVEFSRLYTQRIQLVTAEQVREVARKYLTPDAMVITRMVGEQAVEDEQTAATTEPQDAAERFVLPNGLTVVLSPSETVDLVSATLAIKGGVLVETPETNGLGTLMTLLSLHGAGDRSAEQIDEFFDRAGGSIAGRSGNNTFYWTTTVLTGDEDQAVRILSDAVIRPTYPPEELEIARGQLVPAIRRMDEDWQNQMRGFFRKKFFQESPYALQPVGKADVVAKATRDDVAAHHDRFVRAGSAVLAIHGNFDPVAMRTLVEMAFAEMAQGVNELPDPARRIVAPGGERDVLKTENEQAAIMIGWPGMKLSEQQDVAAISVLDTIISGYNLPRGWLHTELRGEGLVYVVHAYNWTGLANGVFAVYAQAQPAEAEKVIGIIRENIAKTLTHEWTEQEIDEAVNIILTQELLGNQTMSALAMQAALDELYGFGYDYHRKLEQRLRAVTPQRLHAVTEKYLSSPAVETITTPQPDLLGKTLAE